MSDKRVMNLLERTRSIGETEQRRDRNGELYVSVASEDLLDVAAALFDENLVHHLSAITGIRNDEGCRVLYHFWCRNGGVTLEVRCDSDATKIPSLTGQLPGADWYEREVHEMCDIAFTGHPNLAPLLLPEDWEEDDTSPLGEEEEDQ